MFSYFFVLKNRTPFLKTVSKHTHHFFLIQQKKKGRKGHFLMLDTLSASHNTASELCCRNIFSDDGLSKPNDAAAGAVQACSNFSVIIFEQLASVLDFQKEFRILCIRFSRNAIFAVGAIPSMPVFLSLISWSLNVDYCNLQFMDLLTCFTIGTLVGLQWSPHWLHTSCYIIVYDWQFEDL